MILDWRAPISRSFYRASVRDPQGVAIRRRFGWGSAASGVTQLTSFEDEHLERGEELGTNSKILTSEIERPRVGPMRDIVATIQPEQDELVRADLDASVCVQGAPGTGKTAVGLHRAAYLLYVHRERLRRAGVLILGPNQAFLHYIAAVLPALGEIDVTQSTVEGLLPTVATGVDTVDAAAVKHDVRMAEVLRRALRGPDRQAGRADGGPGRLASLADLHRRAAADRRRCTARGPAVRARPGTRTVARRLDAAATVGGAARRVPERRLAAQDGPSPRRSPASSTRPGRP